MAARERTCVLAAEGAEHRTVGPRVPLGDDEHPQARAASRQPPDGRQCPLASSVRRKGFRLGQEAARLLDRLGVGVGGGDLACSCRTGRASTTPAASRARARARPSGCPGPSRSAGRETASAPVPPRDGRRDRARSPRTGCAWPATTRRRRVTRQAAWLRTGLGRLGQVERQPLAHRRACGRGSAAAGRCRRRRPRSPSRLPQGRGPPAARFTFSNLPPVMCRATVVSGQLDGSAAPVEPSAKWTSWRADRSCPIASAKRERGR